VTAGVAICPARARDVFAQPLVNAYSSRMHAKGLAFEPVWQQLGGGGTLTIEPSFALASGHGRPDHAHSPVHHNADRICSCNLLTLGSFEARHLLRCTGCCRRRPHQRLTASCGVLAIAAPRMALDDDLLCWSWHWHSPRHGPAEIRHPAPARHVSHSRRPTASTCDEVPLQRTSMTMPVAWRVVALCPCALSNQPPRRWQVLLTE